jgi:Protein of unknown function (DUF1006).
MHASSSVRLNIAQLRLSAQGISCPDAESPERVVTRLGAIQAQDYPGALWSIALRATGTTRLDVERAVAEGSIVRTWPMRGTLHFIPAIDARWMLELLTPRIMKSAARRHKQLELDAGTFRRSRKLIERALSKEPLLTRAAVYATLDSGGVASAGQRGIHVLRQLCLECMLVHGPHDEKKPTFTLFDRAITTSVALDREDALRTLATRYFTSHGPATVRDFVWWTGLTVADAKAAVQLASASLERIDVDGVPMWAGPNRGAADVDSQRAHLLPGFDEFLLGYKDRSAALAPRYAERVVPGSNGVFLPTLVLDGKVRGTWRRSQRGGSMHVSCFPFARLSASERQLFAAPGERYSHYLGMAVHLHWPASDNAGSAKTKGAGIASDACSSHGLTRYRPTSYW